MNTDKRSKFPAMTFPRPYVPGQKQLHVLNKVSLKRTVGKRVHGHSGAWAKRQDRAAQLRGRALNLQQAQYALMMRPFPPGYRPYGVSALRALPWKTVEHNVAFGLAVRGVSVKERLKTAQIYFRARALRQDLKAYPAQLSGGMKQRVGIAPRLR